VHPLENPSVAGVFYTKVGLDFSSLSLELSRRTTGPNANS
jgi:hypothetical protein